MERGLSKEELKQTIDLADLLGREPSRMEVIEFADAFKNEVIDRTQSGKNLNNRNFKQYSKDYAEFKGVSRNDVDLTLFGDMLESLKTEVNGSRVTLKIDDSAQAAKAFGHVSGYEGHPTIKDGPKRDFFGLNRKDAERLANQISRVTRDTTLIDILGTTPLPDQDQGVNISQILSTIGLLGD